MPIPIDFVAIVEDLQGQLTSLNRAVQSQEVTIDTLAEMVIDLLEARDARR